MPIKVFWLKSDSKYEKANLPEIVQNNCSHLNPEEQKQLLEVLTKFEDLFDETLGDWNTEPVSFELKEGSKPYHGRAFQSYISTKQL